MLYKLKLKNSDNMVVVDDFVYDFLKNNPYLVEVKFIDNLRKHSLGYAFFQKHWRQVTGKYKVETIYLHRLIAEKFIEKPDIDEPLFVQFRNGNIRDCRTQNLEWVIRSKLVRNTKYVQGKTKFRGVSKDGNRYRAVIYFKNKRIPIGRYDTAEEAALAYNEKAKELLGEMRSLNKLTKKDLEKIEKAKSEKNKK